MFKDHNGTEIKEGSIVKVYSIRTTSYIKNNEPKNITKVKSLLNKGDTQVAFLTYGGSYHACDALVAITHCQECEATESLLIINDYNGKGIDCICENCNENRYDKMVEGFYGG